MTPDHDVVAWISVHDKEHSSCDVVSQSNVSTVSPSFTLRLRLCFLTLQTLLLMNINGIMPCCCNANTPSSLLQKMSAFYFFKGHGDEVGALPAEIACTVDSAHLDRSVDERRKKRINDRWDKRTDLLFM